jgi:alpha-2-macroglobulin
MHNTPSRPTIRRHERRARWSSISFGVVPFGVAALLAACQGRRQEERAPAELVGAWSSFPPHHAELPLAVPLAPLLAADEPDSLSLTEPGEEAIAVRRGQPVVVRFNRPMIEGAAVNEPMSAPVLRFEPPVRGRQRWLKRNALAFEPDDSAWKQTGAVRMTLDPGLRSLAGEAVADAPPRTLIFDASPRLARGSRSGRVLAGEPIELLFEGKVEAGALSSQMLMYEVDGGRRSIPFTLTTKGRDEQGRVPVAIKPGLALEPGGRMALAISPRLASGGSQPRVVEVSVAPRPRIEGIACPAGAKDPSSCEFSGPPGRVVDIEESLRLLASTTIAPVTAASVAVTPAVAGLRVSLNARRRIVIRADWEPGAVYQIALGPLNDTEGNTLARLAPLAVRSAGQPAQVRFDAGLWVYEKDAAAALRLAAVHADAGEVRDAAVAIGDELTAALDASSLLPSDHPERWRRTPLLSLVPGSRPNRWANGAFEWGGREPGRPAMAIVQALAGAAKPGGTPPTSLVQRTDLGLDAKVLPRGIVAWVTSLSSARPVAGAQVTVGDGDGKSLSATTGEDGAAWVAWPQGEQPGALAVRAVSGDDRVVLRVDPRSAIGPRHLGLAPGEPGTQGERPSVAMFTDRGVYRAGEVVRAKAVVRVGPPDHRGAYSGDLVFKLFGPEGEAPAATARATASEFGAAAAGLPLGDGLPPGGYRVEVWRPDAESALGSAPVSVRDYRPPSLRVDLSADTGGVVEGEPVTTRVEARYPFGSAAAGAIAAWSWARSPSGSKPAGWEPYVFRGVDVASRGGTVSAGQVALDADGKASISTRVSMSASARETALLQVSVRDSAGKTTSASRTFSTFPADLEIGVRDGADWVEHGTPLDVEAIVVDHEGAALEGKPIECRILREGWQSWWHRAARAQERDAEDAASDEGGEGADGAEGGEGADQGGAGEAGEAATPYRRHRAREKKVAHTCKLSSARAPVHCPWTPDRPGAYVLEASTKDSKGRVSIASTRVYVAGPEEHPDRDPPGSPVTLTSSKEAWKVGETAEIALESPFPDAEALFQVQREGVLHSERRRVAAGGQVFRFPVTEAMLPNAFASVTLVRPRTGPPGSKVDLEGPDLRVGMRELTVIPSTGPLSVKLEVAATAEAGAAAPVEVKVTDASGKGVRAEVALFAVDEGTLRLTGYRTPDLSGDMYSQARSWFAWEDVRRSLVSRIVEPLAPGAGGDGAEAGEGRSRPVSEDRERFDPTPLWAPSITTDADGVARTTLSLPGRPAEYRVMAVAVDSGVRSGLAEGNIVASKPLVIRGALPRFVVDGDRFEAVAFVHSARKEPVDATAIVAVNGAAEAPSVLRFEGASELRVARWVEARGEGDIVIRFEVGTGEASDVLEQTVHVAPRARAQRAEAVGVASGRRELAVGFPGASVGAPADLTLTVAPHPFVGFEMDLETLQLSPFAGVEQSASSLIGLAAYAALDTGRRPSGASPAELAARASRTIGKLVSLQIRTGGFGVQGRDSSSDPYLTAHAVHALAAARRAGWAVPQGAWDRAVAWLQTIVKAGGVLDVADAQARDHLGLALRALGEAGAPEPERIKALYDQRERLSPYGLSQLALAMEPADLRREELVAEAAKRVLATREDEASDPGLLRWYDSSPRTFGAVLEASCGSGSAAAAERSRRLASRLLQTRPEQGGLEAAAGQPTLGSGGWSSHEAGYALAGLAAYARRFVVPACTPVKIWWDGAELGAQEQDRGTSWYTVRAYDAGAAHKLVIEASDPVYFSLASRWSVPLGEGDRAARGRALALHRVLETRGGTPLEDGAHVKLGELVRVRLFVYSEGQSPPFLLLRDRGAGGFEVLDAAARTTPQDALLALLGAGPDDDVTDSRGHYAQRSLDSLEDRGFTEQETRFFLGQGSGLREFTYGVRAATVGTFLFPPADVEPHYAPSFVARSTMTTLTVDP